MDKTPSSKTAGGDVKKGGSPQSDSGLTAASSTNSEPWLKEQEDKLIQQRQEGFSEEIKGKTYTGPNAADELGVDLGKCGLLDAYKHIDLNSNGNAYWIEMPNETQFHGVAIEKLGDLALDHCSDDYPLAIKTELAMYMTFCTGDVNHPRKYPDLAIWGGSRITKEGRRFKPTEIKINELEVKTSMNPHVIIEFSWSNPLENEIPKLKEEMTAHLVDLGIIKVGFLIKTIPSKKGALPSAIDVSVPLCGFDIYKIRHDEDKVELFSKYRVDVQEETTIEIEGQDLDCATGISISLKDVQSRLEQINVLFEAEEKPAEAANRG